MLNSEVVDNFDFETSQIFNKAKFKKVWLYSFDNEAKSAKFNLGDDFKGIQIYYRDGNVCYWPTDDNDGSNFSIEQLDELDQLMEDVCEACNKYFAY